MSYTRGKKKRTQDIFLPSPLFIFPQCYFFVLRLYTLLNKDHCFSGKTEILAEFSLKKNLEFLK